MRTEHERKAADLFKVALDEPDPRMRDAFVRRACGGDVELRAAVDALLAADAANDSVTRRGAGPAPAANSDSGSAALQAAPASESPGTLIGRYKLLEQIGEGGFGIVWMAEQREPVKRRVALKVIKLGMDTRQVIARFEAERQALALMDHPNIARVLDAGSTESGRPYFVMELVRGVPITSFCDQERLDMKRRLELFALVCNAVQHAHTKGVIHRDIKPSNVLVTLHDGVPVPKVIDFGIAKATNAELTERTLFTEHRQMIGTPAYMSPEQAEMSGLDIDTRSDVYSLGVLLYELLTGAPPFDPKKLLSAGYAEMVRIIREEEPQRPSTRLDALRHENGQPPAAARAADAAQHASAALDIVRCRATDIRALARALRGELDVIVMKCLEKDRTRRYETASNLAADVRRHLNDEPIEARRDSASYVLHKMLRRYRVPLVLTAAVIVSLVGFGVVMSTLYQRALRAEASAQVALVDAGRSRAKLEQALDETQRIRRAEVLAQFDLDREREERAALDVISDLSQWKRSLQFDQAPLREVFDSIRDSIGCNIVVHWKVLNEIDIAPDKTVTLKFNRQPMTDILKEVLRAADDGRALMTYRPHGRTLLIGTQESTKEKVRFRAPGISENEVIGDVVFDSDKARAALHRRIPELSFEELPAATVASWVSKLSRTRIELDAPAVDPDRKITIYVKNLRLAQVLWMMGSQLCDPNDEVAWLLEPDRVLLSTRKALCARLSSAPLYLDVEKSEVARAAALDLAHRFVDNTDRIRAIFWDLVRTPGGDAAVYRPALRLVQAADLLAKGDVSPARAQFNMGAALYRVGAYELALEALSHCLPDEATPIPNPANQQSYRYDEISAPIPLAFVAMTYHRLERPEQASGALDRAREMMQQSNWRKTEECWDLIREAELLIEGRVKSVPSLPASDDDASGGGAP